MKKVNIVKITVAAEMLVAVPAENETEAILTARKNFRSTENISFDREDIVETAYQVVDVLDSELSQAFEYMYDKQEATKRARAGVS